MQIHIIIMFHVFITIITEEENYEEFSHLREKYAFSSIVSSSFPSFKGAKQNEHQCESMKKKRKKKEEDLPTILHVYSEILCELHVSTDLFLLAIIISLCLL